jgi:hypothetical protein
VVHDLKGSCEDETQPDSTNLSSDHFDFDLGSPELLRFRGSYAHGASNGDAYCFESAARPDDHSDGEPVAQPYPWCPDDYTIPDGNCHPATQPYIGSDSSANRNGDTRAPSE